MRTFKIKGHRVILARGDNPEKVVAGVHEKTGDCAESNWGGYARLGLIVAVQI